MEVWSTILLDSDYWRPNKEQPLSMTASHSLTDVLVTQLFCPTGNHNNGYEDSTASPASKDSSTTYIVTTHIAALVLCFTC